MKKLKSILIAGLAIASVLTATGCSESANSANSDSFTSGFSFVTPKNFKNLTEPENKIYAASDSDTGSLDIYYKAGAWVTINNDELYSIQQYLVPNKDATLYDIVKDIPSFNSETVTYMGYDATTGNVLTFEGDMTWKQICNEHDTSALGVYLEWSGTDNHYYSYVLQYADVSVLYTYTEELNQFRSYIANNTVSSNETEPLVAETTVADSGMTEETASETTVESVTEVAEVTTEPTTISE